MTLITDLAAYEILDSRGNPTVSVDVTLDDGSIGTAAVPSGASTGLHEAVERRDGDPSRFHGKGVLGACAAVRDEIAPSLRGLDATRQVEIDDALIALDGTTDKRRLGANALLGVSMAVARASANALGLPLYRYLGGSQATELPMPLMNVINGGAHADNALDFQEFMIVPVGATTFAEAIRIGSEVFHVLRRLLAEAGHDTNVGDEGGFAPDLRHADDALVLLCRAIEASGHRLGETVALALDPAASELFDDGVYAYRGEGLRRGIDEQVRYLERLVETYPIVSIEDGLAEDDAEGWVQATAVLGARCQLVGDDVFCTSRARLVDGIDRAMANAILVKPNQVGTLTEMFDTVRTAQRSGYATVMSHRSGETEDVTIADLAVAAQSGQIKTGSLSRSDRTAKYNRLMRIERELGSQARMSPFARP